MKYETEKYPECSDEVFAKISLHIETLSIDQIIIDWLKTPDSQVHLCNGESDDGTFDSVAFILIRESTDQAVFYVPLKDLEPRLGKLKILGAYIKKHNEEEGEIECDEAAMEKRDKDVNMTFTKDLGWGLIQSAYILPLALTYAMAEGGDASIRMMEADEMDDFDEDSPLRHCMVGYLSLNYRHEKSNLGLGECMNFVV